MRISRRGGGSDERGITPVVGTILLIALTIAAVSMVAAAVGQMQPTSRAPQVELGDIRAELVQADANNRVTRVSFTHQGGDFLVPKELRVTINGINSLGGENSTSMRSTSDNLIKFGDDTACLLSRAQDFSTPQGDPYYGYGTEVEIFIVHDPSGVVLANVKTTVGSQICLVYTDAGLGKDVSDPLLGSGGGATLTLSEVSGGCPEGERSWKYVYTNAAGGWAGFYNNFQSGTKNMSTYTNLVFWVRGESGGEKFEVSVEDDMGGGDPLNKYVVTAMNDWQKILIPLSYFNEDLTRIRTPWNITFSNGVTAGNAIVYIDYIMLTA